MDVPLISGFSQSETYSVLATILPKVSIIGYSCSNYHLNLHGVIVFVPLHRYYRVRDHFKVHSLEDDDLISSYSVEETELDYAKIKEMCNGFAKFNNVMNEFTQSSIFDLGSPEHEAAIKLQKVYKIWHNVLSKLNKPCGSFKIVLSISKILYVGIKKKGSFQHSSFLVRGATLSAERIVYEKRTLKDPPLMADMVHALLFNPVSEGLDIGDVYHFNIDTLEYIHWQTDISSTMSEYLGH